MRIFIDADGCPVVDETVRISCSHSIECIIMCDTSHIFEKAGAKTVTVSKGADSVDLALVNRLRPGDLVITQDYGLAAMCLAKNAYILDQNGMEYTDENIDALLFSRHTAAKIRRSGGRLRGISKRSRDQNAEFERRLEMKISSVEKIDH